MSMLGEKRLISGTCAALAVAAAVVVLPAATGPALAAACPTPAPNATAPSQITVAERTSILNQHNQARAATGAVPAIPGLVWDATLANKAQGWANIIGPSKHSECHSGSFSSGQGENIADFGTVASGVQFWYNEKSTYHYPTPVAAGAPYLHYTQMVWRTTTRIGCGKAPSAKYYPTNIALVCRYSPGGNIWGRLPY
jgi:pathogenesis-related protein 1